MFVFLSYFPLLPIAVTVTVFLLLRQTFVALIAGAATAAFILSNFAPVSAIYILGSTFLGATQIASLFSVEKFLEADRLPLLIFIVFLNVIISIIYKSGVVMGYYNFLSKKLKTQRGAEFSTLALGTLLFIDDYLSIMTNTKVSSMLSSKFKIPRVKICLLAGLLAAPFCSIVPISTWAADIVATIAGSLGKNGLDGMDAFFVMTSSAPFAYFSLLMICASVIIVARRHSFGVVRVRELELARNSGADNDDDEGVERIKGSIKMTLMHFLVPIFTMIVSIITSILWFGGYFSVSGLGLLQAFKNNSNPPLALLVGTLVSFVLITGSFFSQKLLNRKKLQEATLEGVVESGFIIMLLVCSATFARLIQVLGTGELISSMSTPFLSLSLLPASTFLVTAFLAFLLGSSWATMSLSIATTIPMVQNFALETANLDLLQPLIFLCLGAVISGAVFGSGLSPISDLLNMASKSANVTISDYLQAQVYYTLPIGVAALVSFIVAGSFISFPLLCFWRRGFFAGLITIVVLFEAIRLFQNK